MYTPEMTPEGNPGIIVKLDNLEKRYGTSLYLLDKRSGHLYVIGVGGCRKIEEKDSYFHLNL